VLPASPSSEEVLVPHNTKHTLMHNIFKAF
jgi:hypothetical protein